LLFPVFFQTPRWWFFFNRKAQVSSRWNGCSLLAAVHVDRWGVSDLFVATQFHNSSIHQAWKICLWQFVVGIFFSQPMLFFRDFATGSGFLFVLGWLSWCPKSDDPPLMVFPCDELDFLLWRWILKVLWIWQTSTFWWYWSLLCSGHCLVNRLIACFPLRCGSGERTAPGFQRSGETTTVKNGSRIPAIFRGCTEFGPQNLGMLQ